MAEVIAKSRKSHEPYAAPGRVSFRLASDQNAGFSFSASTQQSVKT